MLHVALRDALTRPGRFLRTVLAIALGVAFVTGTVVLTDTTSAAFARAVESQSSDYDLVVRSESPFQGAMGSTSSREPVPQAMVDDVGAIEGVARAEAQAVGYAQIVAPDGEAISPTGPPTLGLAWAPSNDERLVDGRAPTGSNEVVVDEATASAHGLAIGDQVQILFVGPARTFSIVGLVDASDALGATLAMFDLATAQDVLEKPGVVDAIDVVVDRGADVQQVRARIAATLDDGTEVVTTQQERDEAADMWERVLNSLRTVLLVFAIVALAVAAFQILNTFTILLTQRTRELGLLRALGASRGQVTRSVILEATIVGALASVAGLGLGVGVAIGMIALIRAMGVDLPTTAAVVASRTIVVGIAAGLLTTLVAAYLPARRAGRLAPVAAMSDDGSPHRTRSDGRRLAYGLLAVVPGVAVTVVGLQRSGGDAVRWIGAGAALVVLGLAMLLPVVAPTFAHLLGRVLRFGGEAATLAEENAARDPRRTAATASALMIGIGVVGFVAILADSIRVSALQAIDDTVTADLVVTNKELMTGVGFSPEVAERLRTVPEVASVAEFHIGELGIDGNAHMVLAIDPAETRHVLDLSEGNSTTFDALGGNTIAVQSRVAADHGWRVGDELAVQFSRTGTASLRIAGTYTGDGFDDRDFVMGLDTYETNFTEPLDAAVYLTFDPAADPAHARGAVDDALAAFPNVQTMDMEETKEATTDGIDQMLAMVSVLLLFSLVIAFVGIANTLALSVVERTRELGLLRAVGMSRRQLKRMVRFEAAIIGVLGVAAGAVVALGLAWAMVRVLGDRGISTFHLPTVRLVGLAVIAVVAAGLAAGRPARRATRLPVLTAINGPG